MAPKKKPIRLIIIFLFFVTYFLIASRPVPREKILAPGWLSSLEKNSSVDFGNPLLIQSSGASEQILPFTLGSHFGYINSSGKFVINKIKTSDIYLDKKMWTEYDIVPSSIEIKNILQETLIKIENIKGYPVLLDNRVFILGSDQNELSEIDPFGNILWTYEYGAPLTCIDVAAGLVLTGSIDGIIEVLDSRGNRIFYFEPGGSRYEVILGCAISRNGSRIGIISGIDRQRFILLERSTNTGGEYRVVYHEYMETGFRRPVHILFIDEDRRVVFEREGGIGCFNIRSRHGVFIPLDGEITVIEEAGDQGLLFLVISRDINELIGIKIPQDKVLSKPADMRNAIFLRAPFKSEDVFLSRIQISGSGTSMLVVGGGKTLISFILEDK